MKRRHVVGIAATSAIAALLLAGCSTGTGSSTGSGGGKVTVFNNTDNKDSFDAQIAEYKKTHPDADIEVQYYGVSDGQAALATQLAAGTAPDIINGYPGSGASNGVQQLAAKGFLANLSDRPWAKEVSTGDEASLSRDGKLYALPQTALGIGYIYPKEAMDAAGLIPPTKWSEVQAFCQAAKDKGTVAYALGLQTGWPGILIPYALTATLVYGPDPTFTDEQKDGKATFTDSDWVKSYDMYQQMGDWGCFNDSPNGTTYEQSLEMVGTGKALGVVQLPSSISTMAESAPENTTWELAPFPGNDDPDSTVLPSAVITTYFLNAKSADNADAQEFLDFLASPEAIQIQADMGGAIPAIPIDGYQASSPAVQAIIDYRTDGRIYPFIDNLWPNAQVQQSMISGIQGLFAGTDAPDGITQKMDASFTG
jgi:raffinose/stachyose/melibiose transport system substrate-binding protein